MTYLPGLPAWSSDQTVRGVTATCRVHLTAHEVAKNEKWDRVPSGGLTARAVGTPRVAGACHRGKAARALRWVVTSRRPSSPLGLGS